MKLGVQFDEQAPVGIVGGARPVSGSAAGAIPVVGVGLLYQQGYFRQHIDSTGNQIALRPFNEPGQLPISPLRDANGEGAHKRLVLEFRTSDAIMAYVNGKDAARYARAGVRCFEVDLAGTQLDKLERLARLGASIAAVTYLSADFAADPVDERLVDAGLDVASPSLFVLEGVVPYLHADVLTALCATVRRVAAEGSLFAISVGIERRAADAEAAARAAAFRARVGAMGEPVLTTLGPDDGVDLLARCGWEVRHDTLALGLDAGLDSRRRSLGLLLARAAATG